MRDGHAVSARKRDGIVVRSVKKAAASMHRYEASYYW